MRRLLPLLLLVLVAGCGESVVKPKLSDIEDQIAKGVEASVGKPVEVSCPDDAKAKTGAKFDCPMEAEDGTKATAAVVVSSVDLERKPPIKADWKSPLVQVNKLVADMQASVEGLESADCPALTEVTNPEELDLTCDVTYADDTAGKVNVTTRDGRFVYREG